MLKEVVYFLAEKEEGILQRQEKEIASLGFYPYKDALFLITYPDTIKLFKEVINNMKKINM